MSATDHLGELCVAIREDRPLVLLLGQDAWKSGSYNDPVLEMALKRAGRIPHESVSAEFQRLLHTEKLPKDFYDWLAETYTRQPEQTWMETVSRLPLNAVFTSSIDPSIARAFRINGRNVELVLSRRDNPAAPRDRRNLHLTYLFGRAGEHNSNERPPRSISELRQRAALHVNPMLSRIVETTTPLGVLLIDGLICGRDWLDTQVLCGVLSAFTFRQVFWFGVAPEDLCGDSKILRELAAPAGPIIFVMERLAAALTHLELAHKVDITGPRYFPLEGSVTIGDHVLEIEPAVRLKVSTAATIIEDTWTAPPPPIDADVKYARFRRFHGHVEDARRLVEGIQRDFAIERSFERELQERVRRALSNAGRFREPVLIHGQSGTGKSLALARLAYTIRQENTFPVLFASRATRIPTVEELDDFCLRAEDGGARATLVICDANAPASRYRDLLRGFRSRGRRVVVVGSAYRMVEEGGDDSHAEGHLLEVRAKLDATEIKALSDLVAEWTDLKFPDFDSEYVLPAIYRMLPNVRPKLAAGLAEEARAAEDDLRLRGTAKGERRQSSTGALGEALINAGLIDPKTILEQKIDDFLGVMSDAATKTIDLVMVPGKLDCWVPVNLLMRAVSGSDNTGDIATLFSDIDLFRWSSNDEYDVYVRPRLRLEAELICTRRLGTAHAEIEVALHLLEYANPSAHDNCERRFVLDLVHRLGPDGPFGSRYASHYIRIARALTDLRVKRGFMDPSLMLQEATLRRRAFRDAAQSKELDGVQVLDEARQIVDLALDEFGENASPGLRHACANLRVERAAIYGYRAVQLLRLGAETDEVWQFYVAARDSARNAVFAASSYFANDVSIWVANDLLRDGKWDNQKRAEFLADIWDALERVDQSELDSVQREQFNTRRYRVSQTLSDNELQKDALSSLDRLGSRAGIFLQARAIGGLLRGLGKVTTDEISKAGRVISFMKGYHDKIYDDARCLRYLLRSLWLVATNSYLFGGVRSPLPEQEQALGELLSLVESLGELEGGLGDPRTQYLRAVLMWRLRREQRAREMWYSLSRETAFSDPRRVMRHHVWTESGGRPRLFHGRITSDRLEGGKARVQVEDLRQEVELLGRDFPNLAWRSGATVPDGFHIAFNFIGPIADPPRR